MAASLLELSLWSSKWIRILAVDPQRRHQGIGTRLLAIAEHDIFANGHTTVRTLDQPGNYLAPGVDERNSETIAWMVRRGYTKQVSNTSLRVSLVDNPLVSAEALMKRCQQCTAHGYEIRRARRIDGAFLLPSIESRFSTAWRFEVERALEYEPHAVHIAIHQQSDELAAFAAHNGNNQGLGWFGPAGTLPAHRKRGLGAALVTACLLDIAKEGKDEAIISWIGPRAFYERTIGIAGEMRYIVLQKQL